MNLAESSATREAPTLPISPATSSDHMDWLRTVEPVSAHPTARTGDFIDLGRMKGGTGDALIRPHEAHRMMAVKGRMWQRIAAERGLDEKRPIKRLSQENVSILEQKLGPLSPEESVFYERLLAQQWWLTSFTSGSSFEQRVAPDGSIEIKSYDLRTKEQPGLPVHTNAATCDIDEFAGTDFVYLCLEIGRTLKKRTTRSPLSGGTVVIRTPLKQPALKYAMSMHADIFDGLHADHSLNIPEAERERLNHHLSRFAEEPLNHDNGFARTVFYGPDAIKTGTAKQILLDARKLEPATRAELLSRQGSLQLNNVVKNMSRTQVMVPKKFTVTDYNLYYKPSSITGS